MATRFSRWLRRPRVWSRLACAVLLLALGAAALRALLHGHTTRVITATLTADGEKPTVVYEGGLRFGAAGEHARPTSVMIDLTPWQGKLVRLDVEARPIPEQSSGGSPLSARLGCSAEALASGAPAPLEFVGFRNDGDMLPFHIGSIGSWSSPAYGPGGTRLSWAPDDSLWCTLRVPGNARLRLSLAPVVPGDAREYTRAPLPRGAPDLRSPDLRRERPSGKPPDVFVYLVDALRPDHLGCYGYPRGTSPSIDQFAAGAALFEEAHAASTWTRPSVATLLTGLYPSVHGTMHRDLHTVLPEWTVLLPEILREAGYSTVMITANPHIDERFGFGQGCDQFVYASGESARWANSKAAEMLSRVDPDQPVFVYLHVMGPHMPYLPRAETFARFDRNPDYRGPVRATPDYFVEIVQRQGAVREQADLERLIDLYDAEIAEADAPFGEFLTLLRRLGRFEDALVILVSDHGEAFKEHDSLGHGHTLSHEEMRVPLVIRFPAGSPGGLRVAPRVSLVDVMPTILRAVALDFPDAYPLPGLDLTAVATSPARDAARPIFAEVSMNRRNRCDLVAVIDEHGYKKVLDLSVAEQGHGRVVSLSAVPRHPRRKSWVGLWDTERDVREQTDLSGARPVLSAHLEQRIAGWLAEQLELREQLSGDLAPEAVEMTDELRRQLEALGYVY